MTAAVWAVSNTVAGLKAWGDNSNQAVSVAVHGGATSNDPYSIVLTNHESSGSGYTDTLSGLAVGAAYYCVVSRPTAGRIELAVYSDAARTMLVDTLSVTVSTGRTWQYLYGANSYGGPSSAAALTLAVENLKTHAVAVEHSYYNESWQVLEERTDGLPAAQYLWDPRYVDAPVLRWRDADANPETGQYGLEEIVYYCQDANWNTTALVSAAGTVVERYYYDAYGKAHICNPSTWSEIQWYASYKNTVGYAGYGLDAETGLLRTQLREYHCTLGTFIEVDPDRYVDGMNVYQYCRSNPAAGTDPMGLCMGTAPDPNAWTDEDLEAWMADGDADSSPPDEQQYYEDDGVYWPVMPKCDGTPAPPPIVPEAPAEDWVKNVEDFGGFNGMPPELPNAAQLRSILDLREKEIAEGCPEWQANVRANVRQLGEGNTLPPWEKEYLPVTLGDSSSLSYMVDGITMLLGAAATKVASPLLEKAAQFGLSKLESLSPEAANVAKGIYSAAENAIGRVASWFSGEAGEVAPATAARTFTSSDPLVADLANRIESAYPGHVVGVNVPLQSAIGTTDADILLQNAVIQVKSGGSAQGLLQQLRKSEAATGLPSLGFGPNLPTASLRTLSEQGGLVTADENLLLEVIKP